MELPKSSYKHFFHSEIILAAHYESKFFEGTPFQASIDSAVPCAQIVYIVRVLQEEIAAGYRFFSTDAGPFLRPYLKIIFFDGEEAFTEWSPNDSLYGARHLSQLFASTPSDLQEDKTQLETVDSIILLDLLGGDKQSFYSYHKNTTFLFDRLEKAEKRLHSLKLKKGKQIYFNQRRAYHLGPQLQDDHTPWTHKGVAALHIIPVPFPTVWHTPEDNIDNVVWDHVEDLTKIFSVFLVEVLRL